MIVMRSPNKARLVLLLLVVCTVTLGAQGKGGPAWGFNSSESDEQGLVVLGVLEDSPAEKAGIVRGDILLQIEGNEIGNVGDVYAALEGQKAGETIQAQIQHGDEVRSVRIRLEDRLFRPPIGLRFAAGKQIPFRSMHSVPVLEETAAFVTKVVEGSPAEEAGLRAGDRILYVDDVQIDRENPLEQVVAGYDPQDEVTLGIVRAGKQQEIGLRLGATEDGTAYLGIYFMALPGRQMPRVFERLVPRLEEQGRQWQRQGPRLMPKPKEEGFQEPGVRYLLQREAI